MSLFRKASQISKKFKICVYGPPGCGKTLFALSFPKPAVIDMERGTDWYAGREAIPDFGQAIDFSVSHTKSAKKVIEAIEEIESDLAKNPDLYETIVIDPVTVFWDALQDAFIERLKTKSGKEDIELKFQHWKPIKSPYKSAMTKLLNLPLHMILVGREAVQYEMKGKELVQVGTKIQSEKDTPYVADLYMRFFTKKNDKTGTEEFFAEVEKDRTGLLKKGTRIQNCNYAKLAELAVRMDMKHGEKAVHEDDKEVLASDTAVFDEPSSPLDNLLQDEAIEKLYKELDWTPGKVRAMMEKHNLVDRESLGKYLATQVREKRAKG